jgi:WD40 repeat protein
MLRLAGSDLLNTGNWQHTSEGLCAFFDKRLQACAEPLGLECQQVRLLLVLDQMEELFTLRRFQHQDRHIITQLISLLARNGRIWVITTFRSDFYHRCVELPPLTGLLEGSGQYLLTPPSPSEISQMIRLPAFAAGLQFEKKVDTQVGLDELLLEHMVRNPNNLALLGFTLDSLYQKRDAHDVLIFQAYEDLGGLEGALAQHAEAVYQHCPPQVQMAFADLMRTLITLKGDDRPVVGHRILKHKQPFNASAETLLQAFIKAHLITTDRTPDGQSVARIAHEALLHYWPRLKTWILENQHLLRLRSRITEAAGVWDAEMRTDSRLLPDGKPLLEAEELLRQWQPVLKPFVCDFIQASLIASSQRRRVVTQAARKTLRRSRQIAAGFAIISVLAGIGAYYGYKGQSLALKSANQAEKQAQIAKQERDKAIAAQANMLSYLSHEETTEGNAGNGMLYALAALQKSADVDYPPTAEVALYHALSENHEAQVLVGHEYWVHYIDFSPNDKWLVSASEDGTARIWSRADGTLLTTIKGHQSFVSRVHFSPDSLQVLTASADTTARLWSAQDGKLIRIFQGHDGTLIDAQFSPDGSRILTASVDGKAKLWDKTTGQLIHTLTTDSQALNVINFSADGQQILTAGLDNIIWLWDANTGNLLQSYVGHRAEISQVLFQPKGHLIASSARDGSIKLWQENTAKSLHTLHLSSPVASLAFSHNGLYLAAGADNKKAYVWDIGQQPLQTAPLLQVFENHGDIVYHVEFRHDNQTLLSVSDKIIRVWNIADGRLLQRLAGHEHSVTHARFSHDGRWLASTSLDNTARVWSIDLTVDTDFRTLSGHEEGIFHASYSPDGQYLLSASDDRSARLWDVQQGQLHTILGGHTEPVSFVAFSPDGQRAVTASFDGTAKVWHIPSGQLALTLKGHQDALFSAVFSPDGQRIITAAGREERTKDKTAKIWDANTGQLLHTLSGHQEAVRYAEFSPSGQHALTASLDSQTAIWQVDSGKLIQTLGEHTKSLRFAHFSHDNHWLITASDDKNARLWRLTEEDATQFSARLQVLLSGHSDVVTHAAFSPDNNSVLTSSWDKTARLWSIPEGKLLQRLDGHSDIVTQASFSPNGLFLATASKDGTAQLWRKQQEEFVLVAVLNAHSERVTQVLFNPNNQSVATISLDGDIRLWPLFRNTDELIQHARQLVPRALSDAQKKTYYLE